MAATPKTKTMDTPCQPGKDCGMMGPKDYSKAGNPGTMTDHHKAMLAVKIPATCKTGKC